LYLRDPDIFSRTDTTTLALFWLCSGFFSLLGLLVFRVRDGLSRYFSLHDAVNVAKAVLFSELMTCLLLFTLTRLDGIPRSTPLIHALLLAMGLYGVRLIIQHWHADAEKGDGAENPSQGGVILIGVNRSTLSFIHLLRAFSSAQQRVIAVLDEKAALVGRAISGVRIVGSPQELDSIIGEFAIHGVTTERVIIAGDETFLSSAALLEVQRTCAARQIDVSFIPRILGLPNRPQQPQQSPVRETPLAEQSLTLRPYFWLKRGIDIVGSAILIVFLSPVLLAGSLLTLLDVGRPILFWQERLGWKGRSFLIYKFRTLRPPFDANGQPVSACEPSAIGRLLRDTRIDELPQLFNVLFGDMSLIGPRPLLPEDQPSDTSIRLSVRPGISGWAQVNGAKAVTKEKKGELDEWYIRNASMWLDLRIALITLKLLLRRRAVPEDSVADAEKLKARNLALTAPIQSRR
jgi:lipopolysaccharide/colanic/teichoic acid biosynthesis glycosyltransferase